LLETGRLEDLVATLRPAGSVAGVVLGPDGAPATATRVVVASARAPLGRYPDGLAGTITDQNGAFRIDGLPAGESLRILAWRNHRSDPELRSAAIPLTLEARPGSRFRTELRLQRVEEVDLEVRVQGTRAGLSLTVCGIEVGPAEPYVRARGKTGPNRIEVKDASGRIVGRTHVDVPPGWAGRDATVETE
jgi:hypothetical protein